MRVKTEGRRQAIIDAALEVFKEVGYERASMAEISARVGGSKATLYNYFKSKEELFAAAMLEAVEAQGLPLLGLLDREDVDVAETLTNFGRAFMRFVTSAMVASTIRMAIAEGANSSLGSLLYARGPQRVWQELATRLAEMMDAGALRKSDPEIAALHLKSLLEAGLLEPALYGAPPLFDEETGARWAVEAFLQGYARQ
jgi:AcrR family transcriptional regulator